MKIENVKLTSVFLGIGDHGLLTGTCRVEGKGWAQYVGGCNYTRDPDGLFRFVQMVLKVTGGLDFVRAEGALVRIRSNEANVILEIGHAIEDIWFRMPGCIPVGVGWSTADHLTTDH